jgi:NAD(P)-dependent dehydrogenase (short-subunit alcohol dehydrogenase family)
MTMTVLVTGVGTEAGSSMANALTGETLQVLSCNARSSAKCAAAANDVADDRVFSVHECDDPEYVGDLLALCVRHEVDVLVPTTEREQMVLGRVRNVFERLGTQIWLAPTPARATRSQARRIAHAGQKKSRTRFVMSQWFSRMATTREAWVQEAS